MPAEVPRRTRRAWLTASLLLLGGAIALPVPARAAARDVVEAVVGVRAEIPAEARTAGTLGREREGSGVVIDGNGLVLTIGYLVLEATGVEIDDANGRRLPAEVVGYDHETGLGLVRARMPLAAKPVPLGRSGDVRIGDPLLVVSRAGALAGRQVALADRREFAASWEYLLPDAMMTSPPHADYGGAALIDAGGRLVGVGSLFVHEAAAAGVASPGNMFVPVDALRPIMADLIATGHRDGAVRPWLGLQAQERDGQLVVGSVSDDGPAAGAGLEPGDRLMGVDGQPVRTLADFYKSVWGLGAAGVRVPLQVRRGSDAVALSVTSIDRLRWLRLNQTY